MSMNEPGAGNDEREGAEFMAPSRMIGSPLPSFETAIVPQNTIAGSALIAVIAIMTFLASLTTGAVMLVQATAAEWQADLAREVTIQIRPMAGRDIEADVAKAAEIARGYSGVAEVRPYSKEESGRLLEPWLGTGLSLDDLPVPRLIVVRVTQGAAPDFAQLRKAIGDQVPAASLDDHRGYIEHMRAMSRTAVAGGFAVLALILSVTVLSVTFATRGAMATNRPVVEVLHFIGAKNNFIAGRFQRHFLLVGLKGGAIGGGIAAALFALAEFLSRWLQGSAGGDQFAALFGTFSIGVMGYSAVLGQILLIAIVTAATSRYTVNRTLETIR